MFGPLPGAFSFGGPHVTIWYGATSVLLGIILFFPVRKVILAMNVNRHQSKTKQPITEEELEVLKKKATIIAAIICMTFAFLYNKVIMLKFFGPVSR